MSVKLDAIFFDLGRVLVHFDHMRGCQQVSAVTGIPAEALWKMFFDDLVEIEYEAGQHSTADILARLRSMATRKFDDGAIWRAAGDIFSAVEGMHELVRQVKAQVPHVGLISNTNEIHWHYVRENFPVAAEFENIVLSYEVQAIKPDRMIFDHAVRGVDAPPERILFIDDLSDNIAGATALGWQGIVFENRTQLMQELKPFGLEFRSEQAAHR
jgi:putative hydrolase of the HAD superfamily